MGKKVVDEKAPMVSSVSENDLVSMESLGEARLTRPYGLDITPCSISGAYEVSDKNNLESVDETASDSSIKESPDVEFMTKLDKAFRDYFSSEDFKESMRKINLAELYGLNGSCPPTTCGTDLCSMEAGETSEEISINDFELYDTRLPEGVYMDGKLVDERRVRPEPSYQDILVTAAGPLIKYLNDNYHPHATAIVTPTSVEIVEGVEIATKIYDYLPKD